MLAGEYVSVFKGGGVEFEEVRPYVPGDDVRSIDWNVTARTGEPFVKRYVEERQLTLLLMADVSASQDFGSGTRSKREAAAEFCALLAFSAIKNDDKVGLILFHGGVEQYIPPRKGQKHALRVVREVLTGENENRGQVEFLQGETPRLSFVSGSGETKGNDARMNAGIVDAARRRSQAPSVLARAREGLAADSNSLVGALISYERERADGAIEAALALRSVERSVEEVLLPTLDEIARKHGTDSAAWAFDKWPSSPSTRGLASPATAKDWRASRARCRRARRLTASPKSWVSRLTRRRRAGSSSATSWTRGL